MSVRLETAPDRGLKMATLVVLLWSDKFIQVQISNAIAQII